MRRSSWVLAATLLAAGCSTSVDGQGSAEVTSVTTMPSATPSVRQLPSPSAPPNLNEGDNVQMVRVTRVVDGDTVHLKAEAEGDVLQSTADVTVRLLEIDTPETVKPNTPVQCFGPEASAYTKKLLPVGTQLWVGADKEARDKYGRYLLYVWTEDGTFLNQKLVQEGYAKAVLFRPNDKYWPLMQAAQTSAKASDKGLWKACAPKPAPTTAKPTTHAPPPPPPPAPSTDPRFSTCKAAKAAGYGPYTRGDTEYNWYKDADSDGVVCE